MSDFGGLFQGCINLTNVDMTGWVMGASANIANMLGECRSLRTITVSDSTRIAGAGLLDLSVLNKANGVWERYDEEGKAKDPWFGTTDNLERRYAGIIIGAAHGDATYRFNTILRGGRFDNDNAWWKVDNVNNILSIGADDDEDGETLGKEIRETASADGTRYLPWLELVDGQPIVTIRNVEQVKSYNGAQPLDMSYWFKDFVKLNDFDGTGFDTSRSVGFTGLFMNDAELGSGNGVIDISSFDMARSALSARANMFLGVNKLLNIKLGPKVQLSGTGLDALEFHDQTSGTWVRRGSDTDYWIGTSASLVTRYGHAGSEGALLGEAALYFWDITLLRNVFQSNGNIWWEYDSDAATLRIGATNPNGNVTITERPDPVNVQNDQPWLLVIGKAAGTGEPARALGRSSIRSVVFEDKLHMLYPADWFKDYVNLENLRFAKGMDFTGATSFENFCANCTAMHTISGMGNFTNTSGITTVSHMFDGTRFATLAGIDVFDTSNVTDFSYFLANNRVLRTFDRAAQWNTSNGTNFSHFFYNCRSLTTMDISGWDMTKATSASSRENFLAGLNSLEMIYLGDRVILTDSGLGDATLAPDRAQDRGSFQASVYDPATATNASVTHRWLGPSADLERRYPVTSRNYGANFLYEWRARNYSGRFGDDNGGDMAWWKYDAVTGTLTVGTDTTNPILLALDPAAAEAAWIPTIDAIYEAENQYDGLANVKAFIAEAYNGAPSIRLSAWSLENLFATYYTGLASFNGAGLATDLVISMAHMFEGCDSLASFNGVEGWDTSSVTTLASMFKDTKSAIEIEGTQFWNTAAVTDFSSMFENATGVESILDIGTWDVSAGTTFENMFKNATSLKFLNIAFTPTAGGHMDVAAMRAGMLANVPAILELTVGNYTVLADTGFDDNHKSSRGSWERRDESFTIVWFGTTANLLVHYPVASPASDLGIVKYTWEEGTLRGRFTNENAWWQFTYTDDERTHGDLIIGLIDTSSSADHVITETADQLPWADAFGDNRVASVTMQNGVAFVGDNLAGWFENYTALEHFDGTAMDVSGVTSFANLFKGDEKLIVVEGLTNWKVHNVLSYDSMFDGCKSVRSIDIHGWEMNLNATRVNMFRNLDSIISLYLGLYISLEGTALFDSDTRNATMGSWMRATKDADAVLYADDPWFGSSDDLVRRYGNPAGNEHGWTPTETYGAYYYWQTGVFRGRFGDNDNAWWAYDRGTLTFGMDLPETWSSESTVEPVVADRSIYEADTIDPETGEVVKGEQSSQLPWEKASSVDGLFNCWTDVVSIVSTTTEYNGVTYKLNPRNLSFWFRNYTGLKSFDGSLINMNSDEQDLTSMFEGCTSLAIMNFSGWEWDAEMARANMLANLPSASSITIKRVVLEGTGLGLDVNGKELSARAANVGRWVMDNNIIHDVPWFGPTAKLVSRYDVILSVAIDDEHMYTWDSKYAGGRVDNNPNAWWTFSLVDDDENDVKKGTLTLGSDASEDRDIHRSGTATLVDGKMEYSGSTLQWAVSPGQTTVTTTTVKDGAFDTSTAIEDLIAGIPDIAAVRHISTLSTLIPQDTMLGWFSNMINLESFDGTFLDASHVTSFNGLFAGCKKLAYVKIGNWIMHDDAREADVTDMFRDCQSLYKLTVGKGRRALAGLRPQREPDQPRARQGHLDLQPVVWLLERPGRRLHQRRRLERRRCAVHERFGRRDRDHLHLGRG